jgi:hypothetical protein
MYIALLFLILLAIAVLAFFEDDEMQSRGWLLIALATVLTLFVAFRPAGIDNDYNSYLGYYRHPSGVVALLTEPTFKIINGVARYFEAPLLLFVIYAFLAVPLKVYAIKRLSPYWYLSVLLWFTHLFVIQEMTQIRVAVSSGIFLFSLPFLAAGEKKKFSLCLVFAILFHYSALALLPLLLLDNRYLSRTYRCALVILPIVVYAFPFAGMEMLKWIPIPFVQQKLQMYEDLMVYEGGEWAEINIYNAMALVRLFAYYMLIWKYDYLTQKYPYMSVLLKVFCYSICVYVGLSFLPPIAMRVEEFIAIIDCILFPLLAVLIRPHWLGRLLVILYAICILLANLFLYKLLKM